jgi:mRNA-degrading endonuclease YafQ of YafQ-DinJ toxin-antitoxin module
MTYNLIIPDSYTKKLVKFLKLHPELVTPHRKTLELLEINPHHPSLRLHKLLGNLKKFHSVSINMKYRIVIDFIIEDDQITLIDINNHYD